MTLLIIHEVAQNTVNPYLFASLTVVAMTLVAAAGIAMAGASAGPRR